MAKSRKPLPFSFGRDKIIQPKFSINFFEAQMNRIIVKLCLRDTSGRNRCGQSRNFSLDFAPAATPLAGTIRVSCTKVRDHGVSRLVSVSS